MSGGVPLLVGVDLGTTSAKAVVLSEDGTELAAGQAVTPWDELPTGGELHPDRLVDVTVAAALAALREAPPGPVVSLGVTSMAETGVLLDAHGEPLAPAIVWHDRRGEEQVRAIAETLGEQAFAARTGLILSTLCTIAKYGWLRANHPQTAGAVRWLNVADWVVHRLGGAQLAELSLASRTGWLDLATRSHWQEGLDLVGAPRGLVADLVTAGTPAGTATRAPAPLTGAVLTAAGHDHLCAAVGVGAVHDGDVLDSCGTAEAFVASVPPPMPTERVLALVADGVTVGWSTVPDRQALLGAQWAGLHLQRILDLLGADLGTGRRQDLDAAALLLPDSGGLRFEGFGADDATLHGVGAPVGPAHVWRAALEAMGRRSAELLAMIERGAGPTRRLVVGGGWARSSAVMAVKRASLGAFEHADVEEPGARGAALLGGVAAGLYGGVRDLPPPRGGS